MILLPRVIQAAQLDNRALKFPAELDPEENAEHILNGSESSNADSDDGRGHYVEVGYERAHTSLVQATD